MIRFEQVFKRYPGGREALSGVDMSMESGEMAFLTGRSGAGKSTMLKLIGLLERPTRGQVIIGGRNTGGIGRRQIPAFRRRIGMVFQDHKLLNDRTVYDNVALPLVIRGMAGKDIEKIVTSSEKISRRGAKIEQLEFAEGDPGGTKKEPAAAPRLVAGR